MLDEEIVDLFILRDEKAIASCGEKYGAGLRSISNNVLDDIEAARECENDTYLQAWNLIPPNEPRTYLFPFLARIVRHVSLDRCRKNNAEKRNALVNELSAELEQCIPDIGTNTEDAVAAGELGSIISSFLRSLPEIQRKIFMRRYWYMDSVSDIAKTFGFSEGKVKTILFRARKKMREYLEKEGYAL